MYWGPMGCLTGNYLLVQGDLTSEDILPLMRETFSFIRDFTGDSPGATPKDCGNFSYMNLEGAKAAAALFLDEVLTAPTAENLNYPV